MPRETVQEKIEALCDFAELDGTEWGEMIQLLVQTWGYRDYCSPALVKAIEKDISTQLAAARKNAIIVETVETHTRTVRSLDWM